MSAKCQKRTKYSAAGQDCRRRKTSKTSSLSIVTERKIGRRLLFVRETIKSRFWVTSGLAIAIRPPFGSVARALMTRKRTLDESAGMSARKNRTARQCVTECDSVHLPIGLRYPEASRRGSANRRGFRVAAQGGRHACFEKMAFCAFACRYWRGGGIIGFDAVCSTSAG